MSRNYGLDPVSAISEAEATGEVAEVFAEIRATMQLPMLTSIWRILVSIPGGLQAAWSATKPLFETGLPEDLLSQYTHHAQPPTPSPLTAGELAQAGILPHELAAIRSVLTAYNRSNGLNLIALTGLLVSPSGSPPTALPREALPPWVELPTLLTEKEMSGEAWKLVQRINRFGATGPDSGLATLWRHLAHWPGLLALVETRLTPLQCDGVIQASIEQTLRFAEDAGSELAHLRHEPVSLPPAAREIVEAYVREPGKVARMVAIGHGLAHWLESANG